MTSIRLAIPLLAWYANEARELPWRETKDPYAVWVSEIMLQQTRVETVIPYYERWMSHFPTLESLANADLEEVLRLWEGLGYYQRARNLHRAARQVIQDLGGAIPKDVGALRKLAGIGRYTAGAIASIAFDLDVPTLDGNIRRVLTRLYAIEKPLDSTESERQLWELASELLVPGRAGEFNQALMEMGATICTPRSPKCSICPLTSYCKAYKMGIQEELPRKKATKVVPHHTVTAAVIQKGQRVLITQRPLDGLLGGMWEFPGGKIEAGEDLATCLRREIHEELGVYVHLGAPLGIYRHAYTHFKITLHAFLCKLYNGEEPQRLQVTDLRWVYPTELNSFPMGKVDRMISTAIQKLTSYPKEH